MKLHTKFPFYKMSVYWIIFGVQSYLLRYLILWTCGFWFAYTRNKNTFEISTFAGGRAVIAYETSFIASGLLIRRVFLWHFFSVSYIITYFLCLVKGQATELVSMGFNSVHGVSTTSIRTLWGKCKDLSMLKQVILRVISVLQTVKCTKEFTFIWHAAK
jgi:hypothetical protein